MNTQLHQLQNQNPGIALGTLPLHDAAAMQQLNWAGLDPTTVMPQLLAYQRLWRLHPEAQVVETLLDHGISSAHQIAAMGLGKFQATVGAALRKVKPAPRLTVDLHASAQKTTAAVAQYAVHAIPSQFMSVAQLDTRTSGLPDFHGDSPTYRELFGPISSGACNDCDSIFSPAAYFVDLMQLIDEYISHAPGNNIPVPLQLQARRPDLWQLLLNCENTVQELPYLQLANGIMASTLKPYLNGVDPWEYAATNAFPFQLPYNKPLEEIRAYAQHFGLSLADVYAAIECAPADVARERLGMVPEAYTMLKSGSLSDLETAYGVTSLSDLSDVGTFLHQTGLDLSGLEDLLVQDEHKPAVSVALNLGNGTNPITFSNAIMQVPMSALTIEVWAKVAATSMIGQILGNGPTSTSAGFGLTYNNQKLYFNLSDGSTSVLNFSIDFKQTDWTHIAAVWNGADGTMPLYLNGQLIYTWSSSIHAIPGSQVAFHIGNLPTGGSNFDGEVCQARIWSVVRTEAEIQRDMYDTARNSDPNLLAYWPIDEGSGSTINGYGSVFCPGTVTGTISQNTWVDGPQLAAQNNSNVVAIRSKYFINASLSNLFLSIEQGSDSLAIKTYDGNTTYATAPNTSWAALNAVIRLSNTLGWSYADVDWALKSINAPQPGHWTDANLEDLAGILQLSQGFGQSVDAVAGLWYDLKTYGRSSGRDRKNFWDQTFNSPTAFANPQQAEHPAPYHPQYASNPFFTNAILLLDVASTETVYAQLRLSLSQALQTTEPDMTAILEYILRNSAALVAAHLLDAATVPSGSDVKLTDTMIALSVRNMSLIYRLARLPQWLKLPVDQFIALLPLLGMVGFATVKQVLQLEKTVTWLQKNQLNVFAYAWLLGHALPGKAIPALPATQRQSLEKNLLTGSQAVMLTPRHLESETVTAADAIEIYAQLVEGRIIDARGLILHERPLNAETIASVMAGSATLSQKFQIMDPQQQVLTFDGTSHVNLPFDIAANPDVIAGNSFTFVGWMLCQTWPVGQVWDGVWSTPTDTPPSGQSANGYKGPQLTLVGNSPGHFQGAYSDANHGWHAQTQVTTLPVGEWCHVAWVNDKGVWTIYVNGKPTAPWKSNATTIYQTTSQQSNIAWGLQGQMIHVSNWSAALDTSDIQALMYAAPSADASHLVGYWAMNRDQGTRIPGIGGPDGTLVSGGTWSKLTGFPIPDVANQVALRVQEALEKQNALALQKLANVYRVSNTQMVALHALTAARTRSSLRLGGTLPYLEVPYQPALAGAHFSVSAWVRPDAITGDWQAIYVCRDDQTHATTPVAYGFALVIDQTGHPLLQIANGSAYVNATATHPITPGRWLGITATFDGSTALLYVNGSQVATHTVTGYQPVASAVTHIGQLVSSTNNIFGGAIADVRYYSAALAAADVLTEIQNLSPQASGLVAWWPLAAGSNTTAYDWSGNGLNAKSSSTTGQALAWEDLHVNTLLSPMRDDDTSLEVWLKALAVNVAMAQKFGLDTADTVALLKGPEAFGLAGPILRNTQYTAAMLESLADLRWLKAQYPSSKDQWLKVMALYHPTNSSSDSQTDYTDDNNAALALAASLTGWSSTQLSVVLAEVEPASLDSLHGLMRLCTVLQLAKRMGVQPSYLVSLSVLAHLPAAGTTTVAGKSEQNWAVYNALSASMADALQAQYSEDQLQAALAKVQGPLWEKERNILAALLIHFLSGVVNDVNNLQALYEYLLVDVKMASNVKISRIEQALDGLQLYVNRCMNGLETGAVCYIPKAWWSWMGSYRQWQANREVYLYPENYADPSLRKAQTPLFKSLVNTLNQGQLTEPNIEKAIGQYIVGMSDIANLVVVDSYARKLTDQASGKVATELYVLGRSRQDPPTYYVRRGYLAPDQPMAWTAWEQLDFSIGAEIASVIYAFDRLYIFWVQQTTKSMTDTTVASNPKVNIVEATIYFTFQKLDGSWLQPQTLAPTLPIYMEEFGDTVLSSTETIKIAGWDYKHEYWLQKPWKQVQLTLLPATSTQESSILICYGDMITTSGNSASGTSSTVDLRERQVWEKMLEQANARAAAIGASKVTTLYPAMVLTASGNRSVIDFSADPQNSGNLAPVVRVRSSATHGTLVLGAGSVLQTAGLTRPAWQMRDKNPSFYRMDSLANGSTVAEYFNVHNATVLSGGVGKVALVSKADWKGRTRNLIQFPGAGSCSATISNYQDLRFENEMSVAAWVNVQMDYNAKSDAGGQHPQDQIIFGNSNSGLSDGVSLLLNQGTESSSWVMKVELAGVLVPFTLSGSNAIALNTWYHLAFTWNKSTGDLKFYRNGVLIFTSSSHTTTPSYSTTYVSIGENYGWQGYFGGFIADLVLVGTELSAAEIVDLYEMETFDGGPSQEITLLSQISSVASSTTTVANRTGIFFADTGRENFLCLPADDSGFKFVEDCLTVTYPNDRSVSIAYSHSMLPTTIPTYAFHRFDTSTCELFWKLLVDGGPDALLQLKTQYASEPDFSNYAPATTATVAPVSDLLDFNGPMREYFWELFFHVPLYVGNLLQAQQQFAMAREWYGYVFQPEGRQPKGLIGYWPLDGSLKAAVGTDASFQSNNGAWVGSTFVDGSMRRVLDLSNSYVNLDPKLVPVGDTVSIAFWLYGNFPSTNYQKSIAMLTAYGQGLPSGVDTRLIEIFLLYSTDNTAATPTTNAYWEAGNDGSSWDRVYHSDVTGDYNGNWNHFAFTKNAATGSLKVYRNGVLWFSGTSSTRGIDYPAASFTLGNHYQACITELSIWSTELSADAISAAYHVQTRNNWNFRPFSETAPATLAQTLTQAPAQLAISKYDPFDPDALATIRWGAWEKNVFQNYVRNLIGWGDSLFTIDTWEAVSEATQLYVTAGDLLGVPPKPMNKLDLRQSVTYGQMEAKYGEGNIPEFLIDMETRVATGATLPGGGTVPAGMASILNGYFCIPDNQQLTQLWGLVANRLYKIRHGLNLQGQATQPALFGPPLNPADLVDGGAYGASGPSGNNVQVPYYRFEQTLQLAKSFTQQVVGLGNELLAALEKQDGETLSQLRQTQESAIFNMTLQAKADMVNQLLQTQVGLQYSLDSAQNELETLQGWASQVLLPQEALALKAGIEAFDLNVIVAAIKASSSLAYLIPDIFGLADGGMDFGDSVKAIGEGMAIGSQLLLEGAGLSKEIASYIRREQEWDLRIQTTVNTIGQIQAQMAANQFAISAAQQDYSITQTQYQQSQDVLNFLQTKFTNEDLYVWMAGQLSTLYYQSYQMAQELAQQAQTCYQYELSSSDTFLTGDPWNDQYKGLLAGDALSLSLAQMEKAYHDNNSRYQEIHKTFSLMQKDPKALLDLKQKGNCTFSFTELDFDLDFPGHYNRKIASISVTIPAVVGPYQNLNATLIQISNQVLIKPDLESVKSLLNIAGAVPKQGSIRSNWAPNQQISISTGINDAGLFQLNFNDPQYLPFEGTGAISNWQLIMPKAANAFDFNAITDVIIQISYTSSPGGQTFAKQVTQLDPLAHYQGTLFLSLRQQYSSAWYAFLNSSSISGSTHSSSLNFNLLLQQFPVNLAPSSVTLGDSSSNAYLALSLAQDVDGSSLPAITLNPSSGGGEWVPSTGAAAIGSADSFENGTTKLPWSVAIDFSSGGSALLDASGDRIDPAKLLDVYLVVPFGGDLSW